MKRICLAMCMVLAVFAAGADAPAEDLDVRALQAKLAAQEARLNDLQAKVNFSNANANANYGGAPEALLSINKNAVVTVGGLLNTRYFYTDAKIKAYDSWGVGGISAAGDPTMNWLANPDNGNAGVYHLVPNSTVQTREQAAAWASAGFWGTKAKAKDADLTMSDAKLRLKIDINEHFDAWLQIDLTSSTNTASDNAEQFWIRWKNICNSGFGVLVGRNPLVFGQANYGAMKSWSNGSADGIGRIGLPAFGNFLGSDFSYDDLIYSSVPAHARWDTGRIMQVTPYWEGLDGRFKWEVSFMQKAHNDEWNQNRSNQNDFAYQDGGVAYPYYKSKNYGWGTISSRIVYSPIEGLDLQASVANFHDKAPGTSPPDADSLWGGDMRRWHIGGGDARDERERWSKNNTMIDLGFNYRPCFFPKILTWAQYIHGWNVDNFDDYDSDLVNFGAAYDFTDAFSLYVQGDYLRTKDGKSLNYGNGLVSSSRKATGWAGWFGLQYRLPYGVNFEAGYRYETITYKNYTNFANYDSKRAKITGNTFFAHVGFEF